MGITYASQGVTVGNRGLENMPTLRATAAYRTRMVRNRTKNERQTTYRTREQPGEVQLRVIDPCPSVEHTGGCWPANGNLFARKEAAIK